MPRSHEIPWIASGPGIPPGHDLDRESITVRTEDTFATVCWLLGLTPSRPVDGRPVTQILSPERHVERQH